jgi:hypothetical protein
MTTHFRLDDDDTIHADGLHGADARDALYRLVRAAAERDPHVVRAATRDAGWPLVDFFPRYPGPHRV